MIVAALAFTGCSGKKQPDTGVTAEGKLVTAEEAKAAREKAKEEAKAKAKATPKPVVPRPPGVALVVHDDCSLDGDDPVALSKTSSTRVRWALEGGIGTLVVELADASETAASAWKSDVVVRCPGTAECFGELQPKCVVGDKHGYRLVINDKRCPDTHAIAIVP